MATQPAGVAILNRSIAKELDVSPTYLAKILQNLCKFDLLDSFRGNQGGFCLRKNGKKINLLQIIIITEGTRIQEECVLGFKECNNDKPCLMHEHWSPILQEITRLLREKTLEDLADELKKGKKLINDYPDSLVSNLNI
tara:strand:- start:4300 stop:4716 length:417 start_codon:yes stop_codon:yes gene_type:complete